MDSIGFFDFVGAALRHGEEEEDEERMEKEEEDGERMEKEEED